MASDNGTIVFDEENPEWTDADFARAAPAGQMLPEKLLAAFARPRGRPAGTDKTRITIRLDNDVLNSFRAGGRGWQSRINEALKKAVI